MPNKSGNRKNTNHPSNVLHILK